MYSIDVYYNTIPFRYLIIVSEILENIKSIILFYVEWHQTLIIFFKY